MGVDRRVPGVGPKTDWIVYRCPVCGNTTRVDGNRGNSKAPKCSDYPSTTMVRMR